MVVSEVSSTLTEVDGQLINRGLRDVMFLRPIHTFVILDVEGADGTIVRRPVLYDLLHLDGGHQQQPGMTTGAVPEGAVVRDEAASQGMASLPGSASSPTASVDEVQGPCATVCVQPSSSADESDVHVRVHGMTDSELELLAAAVEEAGYAMEQLQELSQSSVSTMMASVCGESTPEDLAPAAQQASIEALEVDDASPIGSAQLEDWKVVPADTQPVVEAAASQ